MPEALSQIELTPAEIADLPHPILRKVENEAKGKWMLVGTGDAAAAEAVSLVVKAISQAMRIQGASRQVSESDLVIKAIMEYAKRTGLDLGRELENAKMREKYLARTRIFTAEEVNAQSGLKSCNQYDLASSWKREGKLFAVRNGGADLYPAFQLGNGKPRPVIKKVLEKFAGKFGSWQIAFWFESGNGWLGGDEPQNCLDNIDKVVLAAERLAEPAIG